MSTATTEIPLTIRGLTFRKLTDQIVAALEGGAGYWCASFKPVDEIKADVSPWYDDENLWSGDFKIEVKTDDGETHYLTPESMWRGLQWLADRHLWRIEQMIKETGDAETGDVLLQACLFGDIVYG
jgi:hypothetical protein